MKENSTSYELVNKNENKINQYLKKPEDLIYETDSKFLSDLNVMKKLALKFKKPSSLSYFPRELKNNDDFMLSIINKIPQAYNYVSFHLSKNQDFAIKSIKENPNSIDFVFFKHENFFNNVKVINEALKYVESDLYEITQEIPEHIHKKNICSKEDLLQMFGEELRDVSLVKYYRDQIEKYTSDECFLKAVEKNIKFVVPQYKFK